MIKLKKAFSLAELLIALAIISILTVMFISMSRSGIANAYKLYYYTGYKAMADAISYSNSKSDDGKLHYKYLAEAFGYPNKQDATGNMTDIETKNGIKYHNISSFADGYNMTMTIPSENGDIDITLTYFTEANGGILVPIQVNKQDGTNFKLYERKDLLPFYIDEGIKGRNMQYYDNDTSKFATYNSNEWNWTKNKRTYYSFKNAYCELDNTYRDNLVKTAISGCSGTGNAQGYIKVANPKKVL